MAAYRQNRNLLWGQRCLFELIKSVHVVSRTIYWKLQSRFLSPRINLEPSPWLPKLKIQITARIREAIKERGEGKEITKVIKKRMPDGTIKKNVQGGKDLRSTQVYPRGFGHKVAALHCTFKDPGARNM